MLVGCYWGCNWGAIRLLLICYWGAIGLLLGCYWGAMGALWGCCGAAVVALWGSDWGAVGRTCSVLEMRALLASLICVCRTRPLPALPRWPRLKPRSSWYASSSI